MFLPDRVEMAILQTPVSGRRDSPDDISMWNVAHCLWAVGQVLLRDRDDLRCSERAWVLGWEPRSIKAVP